MLIVGVDIFSGWYEPLWEKDEYIFSFRYGCFTFLKIQQSVATPQRSSCERLSKDPHWKWWFYFVRAPGFNFASIPLWPLIVAMMLFYGWREYVGRKRRESDHECHRCGYNLTGNVSGRCPECGTPVK